MLIKEETFRLSQSSLYAVPCLSLTFAPRIFKVQSLGNLTLKN